MTTGKRKAKPKAKVRIAPLPKASAQSGQSAQDRYVEGFRDAINDPLCRQMSKEEYRDALYEMRADLDAYIAAVDAELEE